MQCYNNNNKKKKKKNNNTSNNNKMTIFIIHIQINDVDRYKVNVVEAQCHAAESTFLRVNEQLTWHTSQ